MEGWIDLGYLEMHQSGVELVSRDHKSYALTTTLPNHRLTQFNTAVSVSHHNSQTPFFSPANSQQQKQ